MEKDRETLKKLEQAATFMLNAIGIPMSYHRHILRIAELKLLDLFPNKTIKGPGAVPFGILFGNTIISTIENSRWNLEEFNKSNSLFDLRIEITREDGAVFSIYPLRSVINYVRDNTRRLTSVYDTIQFTTIHTQEDLEKMEKDENGWIAMKGGFTFRMKTIDNI
jgi:hypothetical protein